MSEEPKFERKDYGELAEGKSGADYTTAVNDLRVSPQCSHDSCTNSTEDPAEPAWVKLMSAVPQASQITSLKAAREGTMMLPEGQTIQSMVASIRPQPEADYALDTIRDEWIAFREDFITIGPKLEQGLSTLSGFWKGTDFDGFEEQTETVLKNCKTIASDIAGENGDDGVVKLIDDKQLEIYEQQGGTSCVYPAPKFYMQGTSCGSHQIHIRPPFFKNCEIHKNDEIKKAIELAGFDPTVMDEVQEGRETTYNQWLEYVNANPEYEEGGLKGEPLATKKADEFADRRLITLGAQGSEQLEEESARVNEEVTERHANAEAHVQEITPDVRKGEGTTFNDGETPKFDSGGLDGGDGGGMPDLDSTGGMETMQAPADLKSLNAKGLDSTGGSGGGLNGGLDGSNGGLNGQTPSYANSGGDLNGLNEENPFGSNIPDPDNVNGGSLSTPSSSELPPGADYSGGGLNGAPPSGSYTGSDLNGLDDNPWNAGADPDDVNGGLAGGGGLGGGGGLPPGSVGGGGLTGGGSSGGMPSGYVPGGGLGGGGTGTTPRRLGGSTPGLNTGPRKLGGPSGTDGPRKIGGRAPGLTGGGSGSGKGGSFGSPPGSSGKGGSLGGMSGSGSGAGGSGGGRGLGGGAGAGGAGAGGAGAGAGAKGGLAGAHGAGGMMAGGGAPGGRKDEDGESERQFWIAEDEDVWGGGPEDEEEDPYA